MNRKLFFDIYNFTLNHKLLKNLGIFTAKYSQKFFVLVYILGIAAVYCVNFAAIIKFIAIPFVTLLYNSFLRHKLNMERPFVREGINPLLEHEPSGSFPSNHGVSSMIIAIAYFAVNPHIGAVLVVIAAFTGISRIMVGIHYPADIGASWIEAWIIGGIGFFIL